MRRAVTQKHHRRLCKSSSSHTYHPPPHTLLIVKDHQYSLHRLECPQAQEVSILLSQKQLLLDTSFKSTPLDLGKLACKPVIVEWEIDISRYHWADPVEEYYWHHPVNHIRPVGPGPEKTYCQRLCRIVATARRARIRQEFDQTFTLALSTRSRVYLKGSYLLWQRTNCWRNQLPFWYSFTASATSFHTANFANVSTHSSRQHRGYRLHSSDKEETNSMPSERSGYFSLDEWVLYALDSGLGLLKAKAKGWTSIYGQWT